MVLDRRGFMKFLAGASAGIMVTPVPWKILDDVSIWTQNWSWIPRNVPGETTFANAVSKMDPSGVPMKVRLAGNRPVRVLPVENHPLGGGVTALSVAEVQMLHSPARLKRPLMRAPDGAYNEISWSDAGKVLAEKLKAAGSKTAFISGDETSSINEVLSALAKALGSKDVFLMPSEGQCAARAADLMGLEAQLGYDLENSDYVLAIGANVLENWGTVVRNRRIFRDSHPASYRSDKGEEGAAKVAFAYAGPLQNNSAAVARPWLPIYPGTEGILALGIANMLIAKGRMADASDFGAFKALAAKYTPEVTARLTGADPAKLEGIVQALLAAKSPLVIVGSESGQGSGAAPVMAGFAVNALLGNINKPGGISLLPLSKPAIQDALPKSQIYKNDLAAWLASSKNSPEAIVLHEANPVYALSDPAAVKKAFAAIPFKVSFSTFMDETTALCDLILPVAMGLERIDDLETPYGSGKTVYCISTVAALPEYNVRTTGNVLLFVARQMGMDLGYEMYEEVLKVKALQHEKCSFDVLAAGEAAVNDAKVDVFTFRLRPEVLGKALEDGENSGLRLAAYAKLSLGTAKTGIPPYNNKTLRAAELDGTLMAAMMNAATAAKQKLADGDKVILSVGGKKIPAKLRVFEGVINDTVAVCLGFGHTALDEFSQNKGANVMELMTAADEPGTGLSVWSRAAVTVSKA